MIGTSCSFPPRPAGRLARAVALALAFVHLRGVVGWSTEGHKRIAQVAVQLLKGGARAEVAKLLEGDLVELSSWEQRMTQAHPMSAVLHWHRQSPEWTCRKLSDIEDMEVIEDDRTQDEDEVEDEDSHEDEDDMKPNVIIDEKVNGSLEVRRWSDNLSAHWNLHEIFNDEGNLRCDGHGTEDGSLFCALVYFFEHFAHDALLSEYPQPKDPLGTPEELDILKALPPSERSPANYLRWLATLIGDMHQPLHWLREERYGNDINVTFRNKEYTLLEIWEDVIPRNLPPIPSAQSLETQYMQRQPAWWSRSPGELFRAWAREEAEIMCHSVYETVAEHVGLEEGEYDSVAEAQREGSETFELDERLYQRWAALAQDFTTLAGQRLAFILMDVLEHKKHKHAHREGRGRHHPKNGERWQNDAWTNLRVSLMVVPTLLAAFLVHEASMVPRRKRGIPDGSPTSSTSFWSPRSSAGSPTTSWKLSGKRSE